MHEKTTDNYVWEVEIVAATNSSSSIVSQTFLLQVDQVTYVHMKSLRFQLKGNSRLKNTQRYCFGIHGMIIFIEDV